MSYLIPNDIERVIQGVSLQQIISGNSVLVSQSESVAITEMKAYLRAKYDVSQEFTDSTVYNPSVSYKATNRVYLDAPAYIATSTYALNTLILQAGLVYYCSTVITVPESFTPAHWTLLGVRYQVFFASYPFPLFNITNNYTIGDNVFWKDRTYTCKIASQYLGQEGLIQYQKTYEVPYPNVFPDTPIEGSKYWTDNGAYNIPAGSLTVQTDVPTYQFFQSRVDLFITGGVTSGFVAGSTTFIDPTATLKGWTYSWERVNGGTLTPGVDYTVDADGKPTLIGSGITVGNGERFVFHFYPVVSQSTPTPLPSADTIEQLVTTYFTVGDNRNQSLVVKCMDMMLYELYKRIPPAVVPELRVYAYEAAIKWLNNVAKGDEIIADIPKLQPPQGGRIRMGSNTKSINIY